MSIDRVSVPTRILAGVAGTLSLTVYDGSQPADPGTVTVTVTRADGTAVVTDAPATADGNTRTLTLPRDQTAQLDLLTATWTTDIGTFQTSAEIIGDHLFSLADLRALDSVQLSAAKFADELLEAKRAQIHDQIEDIIGVCVCPRYRMAVVDGTGMTPYRHHQWITQHYSGLNASALRLPDMLVQSVRSIETRSGTGWVPLAPDDLADVYVDRSGYLRRASGMPFAYGLSNIRVGYVAGFPRVPLDIRRAALRLARHELVGSNLPERATSMTDPNGTFALATAGLRGSWFGLPDVDAVVNRYRDEWFVPRIA